MGQRPFVVWESKGSTRSFSLLLPQLDRQQISLKQVTIKQHLKSGSRSGPRGKRRMNLQKVLENLPPSLLTPSHLVFLLFKNSPLPCYHHHPLDTPNYQELNGVNGAAKESAGNHALEFPDHASLYLLWLPPSPPSKRSFLSLRPWLWSYKCSYWSIVVLCTDNIW